MRRNLADGVTASVGYNIGSSSVVRLPLTACRHTLRFALGVAPEGPRPHREGSLVFPIDRILLKGANLLP